MALIQLTLLGGLIAYKPLEAILIFLVPMITGLILAVYTTYTHHSGLETEDPYSASYNIVSRWYNVITGNLGYHTAHHLKGNLHWSKLPEFHKEIESKIDHKFYREYNPFRLPTDPV
jgi:fatty acid desaturase